LSGRASSWPGCRPFIVFGFRFQVVLVEVVVRFLVFVDVFFDVQRLVVVVCVVVLLIAVLVISAPFAPEPRKGTHWLARPVDGVADVFE
jgi:hypothetical protein